MADYPNLALPPPAILTPYHPDSLGGLPASRLTNTASLAWPTAGMAFYYPFRLYAWATAVQLLALIGATANGNIDVAVYDSAGRRIVAAGSTAQGTINTVQQFNITDTVLPPGDYLLGCWCSSATGTVFGVNNLNDEFFLPYTPVYEENVGTTGPLPATATAVLTTSSAPPVFLCGIQFVATI